MTTDFSKILSDFKVMFDLCPQNTVGSSPDNFKSNTDNLMSIFSSWLFYLSKSGGRKSDEKINFDKANCSPLLNQQNFELLIPTINNALIELKEKGNAYLLTSIVLSGLTQEDKSLYTALKDVVNNNFNEELRNKILNNKDLAAEVLIILNSLATAHLHDMSIKILEYQKGLAMSSANVHKETIQKYLGQKGGRKHKK